MDKWKTENDKDLDSARWVTYEMADRDHVSSLSCFVCIEFKHRLQGMRNYNPAFIDGTKNLRASSFKDHAASAMHSKAMLLLKKKQSGDVREYAPIAKALHTMDGSLQQTVKRKFEVAFMIAKENMSFTKMKPICELEERHGVDLGQGYKNNRACATFVDYTALEQRQGLVAALSQAKFLSLQADGSTDSGNELFLTVYFDPHDTDRQVHVRNKFFTVRRPDSGDAKGLFECFERAVAYVRIGDGWKTKLVGFGCDGTSVNIADRGLKGYLKQTAPWIEVFWCLAHRLELALKDALKDTLFQSVDDMLLRVYYVYEKSL